MAANCPACGCELDFLPWEDEYPSYEICPCCSIQFGLDDTYADTQEDFEKVYQEWRSKWVSEGAKWFDTTNPPPEGWSGEDQVRKFLNQNK